jgi:hypothetical protein
MILFHITVGGIESEIKKKKKIEIKNIYSSYTHTSKNLSTRFKKIPKV